MWPSLLCLLVAAPPSAAAGPERLAVLPVLVNADAVTSVGKIFAAVTDAAYLRPGLRVMTVDDYYFHDGAQLAKQALECGPDTACIARLLRPLDARRGLVVLVNGELDPPLVSLIMLDAAKGEVIAEWAGQVAGGPSATHRRIVEEAGAFLDAQGMLQSGRLRVRVRPDQASIRVGEATAADLGTFDTFTLPPGQYTVHAIAEGHAAGRQAARVEPGQVTWVQMELTPESSSILSSPWLWIGAAVVAAGVAAGVTVAATGSGGPECACVITKDVTDCGGCP